MDIQRLSSGYNYTMGQYELSKRKQKVEMPSIISHKNIISKQKSEIQIYFCVLL